MLKVPHKPTYLLRYLSSQPLHTYYKAYIEFPLPRLWKSGNGTGGPGPGMSVR